MLSHIAEQLARITNATSAYICSYDSETMAAPVIAEYIAPHALPAEQGSDLGTAYLEDEIAFLETLNRNRPTISYVDGPDLPQDEREHMQRYGAQTILYLPLLIRGRPIGYAELWESRWKREFSPEEITLCQGIAQQAAIAIENTRLFEQAQQQIREREQAQEALRQKAQALTRSNELIAALSTVAAKIATTPDPDQVMTTLGEELKKLGMGCVVSQLDLEDQTFVAQYVPIESPLLNQIEKMLGLTINGLRISNWPQGKEIIQHNQPLFEPDFISTAVTALAPIPPLLVEQAARLVDIPRDSKAIYLPMVVTEQLRGLLTIWALDLQEEDTPALMIFANQVAITLENARLYRADQRQKVQLALTSQKLQQELRERKRAEEQIKVSLREKEVLLKEIHHRVKNNLQIISSLLSLQVGFIEDQQVLKIFRESEERIRSMALIHEKLYQSDNLAQIDFAEYIRELAGHLFRSYNGAARGIRLNLQSEDIWLNINIAVSCGLILNELIANSLKHAFPGDRRGVIHIRLYTDHDDQLILRVGDEGIGFPENLDFRHTTSLGLQLVDMLINQLDGTIELERNHGTTFKLTFAGK